MDGILHDQGTGEFDEPIFIMAPPSSLAPVDAILIHPPGRSTGTDTRSVVSPTTMQSVSGQWTGEKWPIVISAYKKGEPIQAIPLDQVMLRNKEKNFVLWIPQSIQYDVRVFDVNGQREEDINVKGNQITVGIEK